MFLILTIRDLTFSSKQDACIAVEYDDIIKRPK